MRLPLHTSLVEALAAVFQGPLFAQRAAIEAGVLDGGDELESIRDLMFQSETLPVVLRLLCLYAAVHGGIPKRQYDALHRDLLNTYGHAHLATLNHLHRTGLLQRRDGRRAAYAAVREGFRLLQQEGHNAPDAEPDDIYFAYAGYAPLSVRLVQEVRLGGKRRRAVMTPCVSWSRVWFEAEVHGKVRCCHAGVQRPLGPHLRRAVRPASATHLHRSA